ncbi:MAG: hypothetical protein AB1736_04095 [Chloroflexota bacterium]
MHRQRRIGALIGGSLLLAISASPASAGHTFGVLDCGSAGTFEVEAASIEPLPMFEAPGPSSGLFLLEDSNRVFRAFFIETSRWTISLEAKDRNPNSLVACTLTSSGLNFEEPWLLEGLLTP